MNLDHEVDEPSRESKVEVILIDNGNQKLRKRLNFWNKTIDFLDLTLLKDPIYVNIVIGTTFVTFSDFIFFTLLPAYLVECGFSMVTFFRNQSIVFA